jgi:hypothetical protein
MNSLPHNILEYYLGVFLATKFIQKNKIGDRENNQKVGSRIKNIVNVKIQVIYTAPQSCSRILVREMLIFLDDCA